MTGSKLVDDNNQIDYGWQLIQAAKNRDFKTIQNLLESKKDISGYAIGAALSEMIEFGTFDVVKMLLEHCDGLCELNNAFIKAASLGRVSVLELFKSKTITSPDYALYQAAKAGQVNSIGYLLNAFYDISENAKGLALQFAAAENHLDAVKYLMGNCLDLSVDNIGFALINAAENGHDSIVEFLIEICNEIPEKYIKSAIARAEHQEIMLISLSKNTLLFLSVPAYVRTKRLCPSRNQNDCLDDGDDVFAFDPSEREVVKPRFL